MFVGAADEPVFVIATARFRRTSGGDARHRDTLNEPRARGENQMCTAVMVLPETITIAPGEKVDLALDTRVLRRW
jgi:hypothetical protein